MRSNNTPFFYLFLLAVCGLEAWCDHYLYGYKQWYAQGVVMFVMVLISLIVFGCGRLRVSKRENLVSQDEKNENKEDAQAL